MCAPGPVVPLHIGPQLETTFGLEVKALVAQYA